jgi:cellulose synthase/poly-beta-1,6-N-acetylglucosamine synthase-like glycosyltransferase
MKKAFFLSIFLVFAALFYPIAKMTKRELVKKAKKKSTYKPIDVKEIKEDKKFAVIIPSYNNEKYVERNLRSVLDQEYQNFQVIYIDDASTDKTYEKACEIVKAYEMDDKVTIVANAFNKKALENLYDAITSLEDDVIAILLDGDDWFSQNSVLKELNRYYNDSDVWLTYGQYINYPTYEIGISREPIFKSFMNHGNLRKVGLFSKENEWFFSHLRTFYAKLFKRIKKEDLLYEGKFFSSAWDLAILFPMCEMARSHAKFIPNVLYVYNRETPINDDKIRKDEQAFLNHYIRSRKPYEKLEKLF